MSAVPDRRTAPGLTEPVVTLLSDFGTSDGFVAAMKGVVRSRCPGARIDDAGHEVPRGDVRAGAWALGRYWSRYPAGTVHLVVIDPGVGTSRAAIVLHADERWVVAPDNGVVSRVIEGAARWRAFVVRSVPAAAGERSAAGESSATFHGRDLFAPVAAALARGTPPAEFADPVDEVVRLATPAPKEVEGATRGEVVYIDRFGNLATNLPGRVAAGERVVRVAGEEIPLGRTYADVEPGQLVAVVNSDGFLEIAVREGSAAARFGLTAPGTPDRSLEVSLPLRASGDPPN